MTCAIYGINETNPLPYSHDDFYDKEKYAGRVSWGDNRLKRVIRLRLLSDPGHPVWDVSYCHGVLKDGRTCDVELPFLHLPRRGFRRHIVMHAKKDGVFAKRLGILDNISTLV